MEDEGTRELQLLPFHSPISSSTPEKASLWSSDPALKQKPFAEQFCNAQPSLDLKLSINLMPIGGGGGGTQAQRLLTGAIREEAGYVEALKWQAAEQIRLAAMESAYAESVKELTRREIELAQSEFSRARQIWQRAREEVEKAERLKERATRRIDSACMEITCQLCRQGFKP